MHRRISAVLALSSLAVLPVRAEESAESQIRSLVRSIGYGAGIHDFKNYVLRASEDYRKNADSHLTEAEKTITALRGAKDLKSDEGAALDAIEKAVKQYHANLVVAQKMIGEGKSIEEIDKAVKVDDTAAGEGMAKLQASRKWNSLDKLEGALGYVGAIHHFKNYVLRAKDEYRTNAIAKFKDATDAIAALRADGKLDAAGINALNDIEGVVKKYIANVEVAQKMIADKKAIKEIDTAVKVDDGPAKAGFAVLRK